ncbi:hypothetical protein [Lunatimonas lonarensis]|uniref:hypothetical protein n=1 Tax=Lunatimonas lonarensis TaxID=1232681 RepID=UPI00055E8652|nr:hypothetical protein [Lunatimonas lonarensis]
MKKKMTLKKAAMATGVAAMSVGLFSTFQTELFGGSLPNCSHMGFEECKSSYCEFDDSDRCDVEQGGHPVSFWNYRRK